MYKRLAVFTAVCITTLSIGCGSSKKPVAVEAPVAKPPVATEQKKQEVVKKTWSLQLDSKCGADVEAGKCLAEFGFTVSSDGKWKTAKAPEGYPAEYMRSGEISQEDLAALTAALDKALQASAPVNQLKKQNATEGGEAANPGTPADEAAAPAGDEQPAAAASEDMVTLVEGTEAAKVVIKAIGADFSSSLTSQNEAKALHASIRNLAARYYPATYPDGCADGGNVLRSLLSEVQSCNADADCTYVSNLFAVDADGGEAILTDRGTTINPLAVANKSLLETNQDKLNQLFNDVEVSCGDTFYREDALGAYKTFLANGKAAVCQNKVCSANPAVEVQ